MRQARGRHVTRRPARARRSMRRPARGPLARVRAISHPEVAIKPKLPAGRKTEAAARALLAWYKRGHRSLPWRNTRDPYAIWVSEIMLQQTRVETVMGYYEPFLRRFP